MLRADVGPEIGYGHLVRLGALGKAVENLGARCCVVTRGEIVAPFPVERIVGADEVAFVDGLAPDLVITDLYEPTQALLDRYAASRARLVCVDDDSDLVFDCDLLVRPNLDDAFEHRRTARTTVVGGAEVILLRDQFRGVLARTTRPRIERWIVCFGGGDSRELLEDLVGADPEALRDVHVTAVIGPGVDSVDTLRLPTNWELRRDVADMAALMASADAGVLAAGTLLYEAAACGLPAAFVAVTDGQAAEAKRMAELVGDVFVGSRRTADWDQLMKLRDPDVRGRIAEGSQALVDGGGARRVARTIAEQMRR